MEIHNDNKERERVEMRLSLLEDGDGDPRLLEGSRRGLRPLSGRAQREKTIEIEIITQHGCSTNKQRVREMKCFFQKVSKERHVLK